VLRKTLDLREVLFGDKIGGGGGRRGGSVKDKYNLEDLGMVGGIILIWFLKQLVGETWSGLI